MNFTIHNFQAPSLNKSYAGRHWSKRKEEADLIHELVIVEIRKARFKPLSEFPVDIKVTAYYKQKRRRDSCNVSSKEIIDGIVMAGILPDDSTKYLRNSTTQAIIGASEDKVEIELVCVS